MTALVFAFLPAAASATTVQPTSGVEPGVTIDEGSPAAKEYALALTQARHTGSSGTRASSSEAPFGAGIRPPSTPSTPGASAAAPARGKGSSRGGAGTGGKSAANGSEGPSSTASLPASILRSDHAGTSSGDGSLLALLGGGVAILVLGGLGGVVLRHNRRPPSHA
jgi:hypothetical protein